MALGEVKYNTIQSFSKFSNLKWTGHQQPNLILEKAKKASDPSSLWTSFVSALLGHGKYLSRTGKWSSINDFRYFGLFFDLPTYLPTSVQFFPNIIFQLYYMVSDFGKSTYLPKNRTSFIMAPDIPQ